MFGLIYKLFTPIQIFFSFFYLCYTKGKVKRIGLHRSIIDITNFDHFCPGGRGRWVSPRARVVSRPASVAFKMVAKFVVAEAVKNQEIFGDIMVNCIEFSNDRIPTLIKNQ